MCVASKRSQCEQRDVAVCCISDDDVDDAKEAKPEVGHNVLALYRKSSMQVDVKCLLSLNTAT